MKRRLASLILAATLLMGMMSGRAVAQFWWGWPGYQQPQQQYYPRAPWYGPRGVPQDYQPRRSRSYVPPPRRTRAEPPRRTRRSEAKAQRAGRVPAAAAVSKTQAEEVEPSTHVAVFGDRLADLVGQGLEEAYEEADDILVVRETRADGGLAGTVHDWAKIIQDFLAGNQKVAYAVVMFGFNDRRSISEGEVSHEPFSDRWKEIYGERIGSLLRVFQERNMPVFWVGAPPMSAERVSADFLALNVLVRDHVERAGAKFVDIWPGFVDDQNRYVARGPDFEGQVTRLRSEGGNFTEAGRLKAAHFVERELKPLLEARASTTQPNNAVSRDGALNASLPASTEPPKPREKPVVGPVLPLTNTSPRSVGGALTSGGTGLESEAIVSRAFRDGLAPPPKPGRADEFKWPSPQ
jgi:uncharacterized protein